MIYVLAKERERRGGGDKASERHRKGNANERDILASAYMILDASNTYSNLI